MSTKTKNRFGSDEHLAENNNRTGLVGEETADWPIPFHAVALMPDGVAAGAFKAASAVAPTLWQGPREAEAKTLFITSLIDECPLYAEWKAKIGSEAVIELAMVGIRFAMYNLFEGPIESWERAQAVADKVKDLPPEEMLAAAEKATRESIEQVRREREGGSPEKQAALAAFKKKVSDVSMLACCGPLSDEEVDRIAKLCIPEAQAAMEAGASRMDIARILEVLKAEINIERIASGRCTCPSCSKRREATGAEGKPSDEAVH